MSKKKISDVSGRGKVTDSPPTCHTNRVETLSKSLPPITIIISGNSKLKEHGRELPMLDILILFILMFVTS